MSGQSLREQLSGLRQASIEKARQEQAEREKLKAAHKTASKKGASAAPLNEKSKVVVQATKPYLKPMPGLPVSESHTGMPSPRRQQPAHEIPIHILPHQSFLNIPQPSSFLLYPCMYPPHPCHKFL